MDRILITGSNGFIGRALHRELVAQRPVRAVAGRSVAAAGGIHGHDLADTTQWHDLLTDVTSVCHLAARAHHSGRLSSEQRAALWETNVDATERLARASAVAGVRRFVFVSSIGVLGEHTPPGCPMTPASSPDPQSPYARSKWEAEQRLRCVAADHPNWQLVIVRPPLVAGPSAPGNLARLRRLVERGVPLPVGGIENQRSLLGLPNLLSLLRACLDHPQAVGQTFLASDASDYATPQIVRALAAASGRSARIATVPPALLRRIGRCAGQGATVASLCDSLQVDSSATRRILDWYPEVSLVDSLRGHAAPWPQAE